MGLEGMQQTAVTEMPKRPEWCHHLCRLPDQTAGQCTKPTRWPGEPWVGQPRRGKEKLAPGKGHPQPTAEHEAHLPNSKLSPVWPDMSTSQGEAQRQHTGCHSTHLPAQWDRTSLSAQWDGTPRDFTASAVGRDLTGPHSAGGILTLTGTAPHSHPASAQGQGHPQRVRNHC